MKMTGKSNALGKAEAVIQGKGGIIRTAEAYREGIRL